ncbi:MAG: hypothetical protein RLZ35_751 [Pseudomonadota bacterium]
MSCKQALVHRLLEGYSKYPVCHSTSAFAPTNIALVKYWGKRDSELNLPVTGSLSITLPTKGAHTTVSIRQGEHADKVSLNGVMMPDTSHFTQRVTRFLDLFRASPDERYVVDSVMNIPVAAGVASSACGFAALTLAVDALYGWSLPIQTLSILARLGSGSASRSVFNGWVEWQAGTQADGMDSYAIPYPTSCDWLDLRIGLLLYHTKEKHCGSREAMQRSVDTSPLYAVWPQQVQQDLLALKKAIDTQDMDVLGGIAEHNAEAMHACMRAAIPSVDYATQETQAAKEKVHFLRSQGVGIYYTQDAGPNLKLLFLAKDTAIVEKTFENVVIEMPFVTKETAEISAR